MRKQLFNVSYTNKGFHSMHCCSLSRYCPPVLWDPQRMPSSLIADFFGVSSRTLRFHLSTPLRLLQLEIRDAAMDPYKATCTVCNKSITAAQTTAVRKSVFSKLQHFAAQMHNGTTISPCLPGHKSL